MALAVAAALLALLHTGHKFQSTLGMVLTAAMLAVVLSGLAGRYALSPAAGGQALAEAMADLEYGLAAREQLRRVLARWRRLHRAASIALFALLALHIWAALEFGLRWLR